MGGGDPVAFLTEEDPVIRIAMVAVARVQTDIRELEIKQLARRIRNGVGAMIK